MKPVHKRRVVLVLAISVPIGLLIASRQVAGLRPRQVPLLVSSNGKLVFSPDGKWLLYWGRSEDAVRLHNQATGEEHIFKTQGWASYCFAPDSRSFAVLSLHGRDKTGYPLAQVEWRNSESGKLLRQFSGLRFNNSVYLRGDLVRFAPGQNALRVVTDSGVKFLPLDGSAARFTTWPGDGECELLAWSEKYWFLDYSRDEKTHSFELYDATTGKKIRVLALQRDYIQKAYFSPDSHLLAIRDAKGVAGIPGNDEGNAIIETSTGKRLHEFHEVEFLFSPDSQKLVAQGNDTDPPKVRLYDSKISRLLKTLLAPPVKLSLSTGAFSPDGKSLYAIDSSRGEATVWKIRVD